VLHGNEPVLAAVPDLDGHPDVAEIEPPASQFRRSVIPPALVARGEGDLVGFSEPAGQVARQGLGVDGRESSGSEKNNLKASTLDSPIPAKKSKPSIPQGASDATAAAATVTSGSKAAHAKA